MVILQPAYSVGEWHYGFGLATIVYCAYCNALQVFQDDDILKCPEQFCGVHVQRTYTNESNVAEDSTGLAELMLGI